MKTLLSLALLLSISMTASAQSVETELDAYWTEAARTIVEGDFEGYAATYHPDAVLVSLSEGTSYSIGQALAGWKSLFDDTAAGKASASVQFRFTRVLHDETTAHFTGIFRYSFDPAEGEGYVNTTHFEMLLVKKDGGWLGVMEYQKEPATEAEWEAAAM